MKFEEKMLALSSQCHNRRIFGI